MWMHPHRLQGVVPSRDMGGRDVGPALRLREETGTGQLIVQLLAVAEDEARGAAVVSEEREPVGDLASLPLEHARLLRPRSQPEALGAAGCSPARKPAPAAKRHV